MCSERQYRKKWGNLKWRIKSSKSYVEKGIQNRFDDYHDFRSFAVENGMQPNDCIHRKDRGGDYCRENVEFVDEQEHRRITGIERRRLTDSQVREARALWKFGFSTHRIAETMPVSQKTIWKVVRGITYADVD